LLASAPAFSVFSEWCCIGDSEIAALNEKFGPWNEKKNRAVKLAQEGFFFA
jgi:hypothetical protein